MTVRTPVLLLGLFLFGGGSAGCATAPREVRVSRSVVEADVRFLASDELQGRRAGRPGADVAARYIAEQFRAAGLGTAPSASDGSFQAVPVAIGVMSQNVIGFVRGTDPDVAGEVVLMTAHYDGLGATMRTEGATREDSVFNGARDNAVGVAALLAAAREFGRRPARRSVLLIATTAEEGGLGGSWYYIEHPLVPLSESVFVLNTDGAGYSDTTAVSLIGAAKTGVAPFVQGAAAEFDLDVVLDPDPRRGLFWRSDNAPFAASGVPSATLSPGFRTLDDPGVGDRYHQVTDEADDLDFEYLARFAEVFVETARRIADAAVVPFWVPGDEYEEAGYRLYSR